MNNTNRLIVAYQVQKKLTEFPQFTLCINPAVAHDHATDIYMRIRLSFAFSFVNLKMKQGISMNIQI